MVAGVIITHITQGGSDEPPVLITPGTYIMPSPDIMDNMDTRALRAPLRERGGMLDWNLSVEIITDCSGDKYIQ